MHNIDLSILQELTDEDIKIIIESTDLDKMLMPIKGNSKHYAKYIGRLGRLMKESLLVKKNLPGIVYELYGKKDHNYCSFIAMEAENLKNEFVNQLHEYMGKNVEPKDMLHFSIDDYKKLFDMILNKNGVSLDFKIFYLQTRMFKISISPEMKKQLEDKWYHMQAVNETKKKLKKEFEGAFNKKIDEMNVKMASQKDEYNKWIQDAKNEVEKMDKQLQNEHGIVLKLISENAVRKDIIAQKEHEIIENNKQIAVLKNEIAEIQLDNKNISVKLKDRYQNIFNEIQETWEKENKEKVMQNIELDCQYASCQVEIDKLKLEEKRLNGIISNWNDQIDSYFSKLDTKIIEHSVESILFQQLPMKQSTINPNGIMQQRMTNSSDLYIHNGNKVAVDDLMNCNDYDDYLEIAETNLSKVGLIKSKEIVNNCFVAAMNAGLNPLICGYGSQDVACALIASRFAEKSKIICIPSGYSNVKELIVEINSAETDTVIIADAFGKMNEGLILPILRESLSKKIVFTAESIEDLKFLPKYYWGYIHLLVLDKKKRGPKVEFKYADADKLFKRNNENEKGSKMARQVLKHIGMESSYIMARADLFNNLLDNDMNNLEDEAWKILLLNELRWIMSDEQKESLRNLFEANEKKYPAKLIECIG